MLPYELLRNTILEGIFHRTLDNIVDKTTLDFFFPNVYQLKEAKAIIEF